MNGDDTFWLVFGHDNPKHPVGKLRHGSQPVLQRGVGFVRLNLRRAGNDPFNPFLPQLAFGHALQSVLGVDQSRARMREFP